MSDEALGPMKRECENCGSKRDIETMFRTTDDVLLCRACKDAIEQSEREPSSAPVDAALMKKREVVPREYRAKFHPEKQYGAWTQSPVGSSTLDEVKAILGEQIAQSIPEGFRWRVTFAHKLVDGVLYVAWLYSGNGDGPVAYKSAEEFLAKCMEG